MIVRFDFVPAAMTRRAASAAVAAALLALGGVASAQPRTAAPAASETAPGWRVVGRYTVKPGQSLHDIAAELTQSHDKGVLARVSHALFEQNPNAFTKHDPSRLKIGAVLDVPGVPGVLEAESNAAASAPAPAPAPAAPAVASPGKATAPAATVAAGATAKAATQGASAVGAASAPAKAATQGASAVGAASAPVKAATQGASAVAAASAPANAAVLGASAVAAASAAAMATAPASAVAPSSAPSAAASETAAASGASAAAVGALAQAAAIAASGASASAAASQPAAATSPSDAHVWSGAVQTAPAASAAAAAAPVTVSSLQQLLALKNRVLMALQKHGIGQSAKPAAGGNGGAASAAGAKATTGVAGTGAAGGQIELSPLMMSVIAAIVAALLALIVGLRISRRKASARKADKGSEAAQEHVEPPVLDTRLSTGGPADESNAVEPGATAAPAAQSAATAQGLAQRDGSLDRAVRNAGLSAAASLGGDALPPAQFEPPVGGFAQSIPEGRDDRVEQGVTARRVERGLRETLADASEAAGFAAAAELGASALPPESAEALRPAAEVEKLAREAELGQAPRQHEAARDADAPVHADAEDTAQHAAIEPEEPVLQPAPVEEQPAIPAASEKETDVTDEFPPEAVSALGGLDMPLPPRVGEPVAPEAPVAPTAPLSTEPVASPETTAAKAVPLFDPSAPPVADAIGAGTAGPGAIAGLGAPRFGALTLDFDLNLPPDSAEPLPVFTPEQLSRIARNKLELAHEYIALGDLAGARSLINEVIESNDHGTRADAQALLSSLAPLS
jgi:FimV-like protein